jgi:hypothetical protein
MSKNMSNKSALGALPAVKVARRSGWDSGGKGVENNPPEGRRFLPPNHRYIDSSGKLRGSTPNEIARLLPLLQEKRLTS